MAAIDFPNSPSNGSTYTVGSVTWTYNSTKAVWNITSNGVQGVQGGQGLQGISGSAVAQGTQGLQGRQGTQGLAGSAASQGLQGLQGIQGVRQASRVASSTSTTTLNWDSSSYDSYVLTAQTGSLTIALDSASSPVNGQRNIFRIKTIGSGTLTITSGTKGLRAFNVTIPSTLTAGNTLYFDCVYNSTDSRWDVINVKEATV